MGGKKVPMNRHASEANELLGDRNSLFARYDLLAKRYAMIARTKKPNRCYNNWRIM